MTSFWPSRVTASVAAETVGAVTNTTSRVRPSSRLFMSPSGRSNDSCPVRQGGARRVPGARGDASAGAAFETEADPEHAAGVRASPFQAQRAQRPQTALRLVPPVAGYAEDQQERAVILDWSQDVAAGASDQVAHRALGRGGLGDGEAGLYLEPGGEAAGPARALARGSGG